MSFPQWAMMYCIFLRVNSDALTDDRLVHIWVRSIFGAIWLLFHFKSLTRSMTTCRFRLTLKSDFDVLQRTQVSSPVDAAESRKASFPSPLPKFYLLSLKVGGFRVNHPPNWSDSDSVFSQTVEITVRPQCILFAGLASSTPQRKTLRQQRWSRASPEEVTQSNCGLIFETSFCNSIQGVGVSKHRRLAYKIEKSL